MALHAFQWNSVSKGCLPVCFLLWHHGHPLVRATERTDVVLSPAQCLIHERLLARRHEGSAKSSALLEESFVTGQVPNSVTKLRPSLHAGGPKPYSQRLPFFVSGPAHAEAQTHSKVLKCCITDGLASPRCSLPVVLVNAPRCAFAYVRIKAGCPLCAPSEKSLYNFPAITRTGTGWTQRPFTNLLDIITCFHEHWVYIGATVPRRPTRCAKLQGPILRDPRVVWHFGSVLLTV